MDLPVWYKAEQFEVVDNHLPMNWYFSFNKKENTAIWGYKELIVNPKHYENLVERDPQAVEIFERRKEEIDEYEELRNIIA